MNTSTSKPDGFLSGHFVAAFVCQLGLGIRGVVIHRLLRVSLRIAFGKVRASVNTAASKRSAPKRLSLAFDIARQVRRLPFNYNQVIQLKVKCLPLPAL